MNAADAPPPVAGWARALAWLVIAASLLGFGSVALAFLGGRPLPSIEWHQALVLVFAAAWVLPLFFIVAVRGRPPQYWLGFGKAHWRSEVTGKPR